MEPYLDCFTNFFFFPDTWPASLLQSSSDTRRWHGSPGCWTSMPFSFFALSDRGCMKSKIASSYCPTPRPPPTAILSMLLSGHVQHLYRSTIARLDQSKVLFSFTSPPAISSYWLFPRARLRSIHHPACTLTVQPPWQRHSGVLYLQSRKGRANEAAAMGIYSMTIRWLCHPGPCLTSVQNFLAEKKSFKMRCTQMITQSLVSFGQKSHQAHSQGQLAAQGRCVGMTDRHSCFSMSFPWINAKNDVKRKLGT